MALAWHRVVSKTWQNIKADDLQEPQHANRLTLLIDFDKQDTPIMTWEPFLKRVESHWCDEIIARIKFSMTTGFIIHSPRGKLVSYSRPLSPIMLQR